MAGKLQRFAGLGADSGTMIPMVHPALTGTHLLALGMPQGWDWLFLIVVALLIFGKRLPEVARSVGKSVTEFKKGLSEVTTTATKEAPDQAGGQTRLPSGDPNAVAQGQTQAQDANKA
jgi:TatA/E family protein of Tat protein translocase